MKVSESWLREWVNPSLSANELADQVTMAGLEVDGIEPVAGQFTGVVVAEIVAAEQHPDADKLRVCQVNAGDDKPLQIVCGAPNARVGIKVPLATVGAVLPGNFKIKKAKLRGVESQGMLCAQTELQAGDDDSGLWELPIDAPVGEPLADYLNLNDQIIEIDLTPNRGDCLSLRGIAREVGVLNKISVNEPDIKSVSKKHDDIFPIKIDAKKECPRYLGRIVKDVDISRPSPLWLQEKLRRAGVRPHDCVVDITNLVLLELGQPMHAFDFDKLQGGIVVRLANDKEPLKLLDGQDIKLNSDTLLITDEVGPVAMAGIMGGDRTAVSNTTKNIFLESAFFAPLAIAGRARSYGMHTDASHRYERGVDFELPAMAMERATELLIDIAGGKPGPVVDVTSKSDLPAQAEVTLTKKRIKNGLDLELADSEVEDIMNRLGLELVSKTKESWTFKAPSYRFDIEIEEDLLEEIARIYGYNRLPNKPQPMDLSLIQDDESKLDLNKLKQVLVDRDYNEAISYSFISEKLEKIFGQVENNVVLQNPISAELSVMRSSLLAGLVNALQHNLNRQQSRVRLFEAGLTFVSGKEGIQQKPMMAGLIYGDRHDENWASQSERVDFYDIKGDVEALLSLVADDTSIAFEPFEHSALHPGQNACVLKYGKPIGYLGALHPSVLKELDIPQSVYVFELNQSDLLVTKLPHFVEISKFPEVRRDIAVLIAKSVQVSDLISTVRKVAGSSLQNLKVFDVYVGKGIDPQRKSVALGLTFQDASSTLTESEINASMDAVVASLKEEFNAELR